VASRARRADERSRARLILYVDADACPVKDEVYRVAARHGLRVVLVANQWLQPPRGVDVQTVVVERQFDAADHWIAERAGQGDVVVTADIPLAARALERGACALGPDGREFTDAAIGDALAARQLKADLRGAGMDLRGPRPMSDRDRSRFASELERVVQRLLRG
jgi:uncharacterized protein